MCAKQATPVVRCPKCKRAQPVRPDASMYFCDDCRITFGDPKDDDGGDYFTDPTKRLEMADEERIRQQNRTRSRLGSR